MTTDENLPEYKISSSGDSQKSKVEKKIYSLLSSTPSWTAAESILNLEVNTDITETNELLKQQFELVSKGDLSRAEEMLISQAHVLNLVFAKFTSKMTCAKYLSQCEAYSKIALRAQNQCQRTLRTLLEYKNPKRATFIKQQNNAINQQINKGELPNEISEKEINPANELLEAKDGTWLDTGEAPEAVSVDSEVETLGKLDRAED
jgi:hypothetical protein